MPRSFHSEEYAAFVQKLVEARQKAGITQTELAKRLGRHQSFVSNFESRVRRLDVVETVVICRVIKLDAEILVRSLGESLAKDASI